jgi:hypothetical protein
MFKKDHYVPILKWKRGEYRALAELDPTARQALTPLLEIQPLPWDFKKGDFKKSLKEHLDDYVEQVFGTWNSQPAFADLELIDPTFRLAGGVHPVRAVFDAARARGAQLIPVTALDRDAAYNAAVAHVVKADGRGVCLRVRQAALFDDDLDKMLKTILATLKVARRDVHLVIDLREVNDDDYALLSKHLAAGLTSIPNLSSWRTFTVAGSGLPASLSAVGQGVALVPRRMWDLWLGLRKDPVLPRVPTFGDYGVAHWDTLVENPAFLKIVARILYTGPKNWVVARGRPLRPHGYAQYHALAKLIAKHPHFCHKSCCASEPHIVNCAAGATTTGSPESWLRVATHHHLVYVMDQIANLP